MKLRTRVSEWYPVLMPSDDPADETDHPDVTPELWEEYLSKMRAFWDVYVRFDAARHGRERIGGIGFGPEGGPGTPLP